MGEAPGADEDRLGEPFVGRAGKLLDRALDAAGLDRRELLVTNVVKCRPPANRKPTKQEAGACRPFLEGEMDKAAPSDIVALGGTAAEALLGRPVRVKSEPTALEAHVAGRAVRVHVALHPAAARFNRGAVESIAAVLRRAAADAHSKVPPER